MHFAFMAFSPLQSFSTPEFRLLALCLVRQRFDPVVSETVRAFCDFPVELASPVLLLCC